MSIISISDSSRMEGDRVKVEDIDYVIAKESDADRIWDFMVEAFFPDEPSFKCIHLLKGDGWFDRFLRDMTRKDMKKKNLLTPHSIMAVDKNGDILGELIL